MRAKTLTTLRRALLLAAACYLAVVAQPAAAQYNYFPTGTADDGRTVALAGDSIETLAQDSLTFLLAVPPGVTQFEFGIFDGETGQASAEGMHWDSGSTQLQYALFYDPYQQGNTSPANLVGVWRGNETNATTDPGGAWTASSATFPDNGWWSLAVDVPEPPEPLPGMAPSGATYYHLCVSYRAETGNGLADPCTGDVRSPDASPQTISNFKIRATANISVLSFAFAYEGAMRFANRDPRVIYPLWNGVFPASGSDFWLTTPTTYDGTWSFDIDVPVSTDRMRLFGGDFDFGTWAGLTTGLPSGVPFAACADSNDADTPDDAFFPPFAMMGAVRIDDSLPEGERTGGGTPPDDNPFDSFRRSPCIHWTLTSPDGTVYANDNPSSQREWEQFLVSREAGCDTSPTCDPAVSNCADYCEDELLPPGVWRVDVHGVDLSNLNAWRSDNMNSFCLNCTEVPRPYLVGDTVFFDVDGDGVQSPGEPGIPGVVMELVDENGVVIDTVTTGDPGSYGSGMWASCQAHNTGGATPGGVGIDEVGLYCFDVTVPNGDPDVFDVYDYTVRVADSNFQPGGALHEYFGTTPGATRPSPDQTYTLTEGGDNVLTYDFGYVVSGPCGECLGKVSLLQLLYLGDGTVHVEIEGRRGGATDSTLFAGDVDGTQPFSVVGPDGGPGGFSGTLGTEITVYVDGVANTTIHTSCSQPIGPGMIFGDFLVVYGESKLGGPLCPAENDGPELLTLEQPVGTGTIGYWKNHVEAWPLSEIELGSGVYTVEQARELLAAPVRGDATVSLAQQLIAAKLNVAAGTESSCIAAAIAAADAFLAAHPPGSKPEGSDKSEAEDLKDQLDAYNNGLLCAPHRG
jgi:hypothetical protein